MADERLLASVRELLLIARIFLCIAGEAGPASAGGEEAEVCHRIGQSEAHADDELRGGV